MNALNINNIIFCIGEENGEISDFWKDVNVISMTNDFSNSTGALLGGLSQIVPNGTPTINFSIEKPLTFNEKLLDYFIGQHTAALVEASFDNLTQNETPANINGANFDVIMTEYSISLNPGEIPLLSASFVGKKVYVPEKWSVTLKRNSEMEEKEIPKMDRIIPYLDIFDDEAIFTMNFSERKNVLIRWPMNWKDKMIVLESPLINQQFSASGYTSSLSDFPFRGNIDLIEKYLNQRNEILGVRIQSEKFDENNDYFLKNSKLNSLSTSISDSDYLLFGIDFLGSKTIV